MREDPGPRWEHGSDFHLSLDVGLFEAPWLALPHALWGSGRCATRALLRWGRERHGWKRLLAPSYFCQEVLESLERELPIALYEDGPCDVAPAHVDADASDALLLVNWYGMREATRPITRAAVIEDHTHDPWSVWASASTADYAVASLRKTLPLPDGGVVWSPLGKDIPPEAPPSAAHLAVVQDRLSGMLLKAHYLAGAAIDKSAYRALYLAAEERIGTGEMSGISTFSRVRLPTLPAHRWRVERGRNAATFVRELGDPPGVRVLASPFAVTLLLDTHARREAVRRALIGERIYAAVLWPLERPAVDQIPQRHVTLSRRLLTLHCDARYDSEDMTRVAATVRRVLAAAPPPLGATEPSDTTGRSPSDPPDPRADV